MGYNQLCNVMNDSTSNKYQHPKEPWADAWQWQFPQSHMNLDQNLDFFLKTIVSSQRPPVDNHPST